MSTIDQDSRYSLCGAAHDVDTGESWFDVRRPVTLDPDPSDASEKPRAGETLQAFAYRMWGKAFGDRATRYWWVLADINNIVNPFLPLDPTTPLRVPRAARIALEIAPPEQS